MQCRRYEQHRCELQAGTMMYHKSLRSLKRHARDTQSKTLHEITSPRQQLRYYFGYRRRRRARARVGATPAAFEKCLPCLTVDIDASSTMPFIAAARARSFIFALFRLIVRVESTSPTRGGFCIFAARVYARLSLLIAGRNARRHAGFR